MVKCPKCGNENKNGKYCDECGTKLSSDNVDFQNNIKNKIQSINRNYLIIGAVIIIIAIIAIAAFTIFDGSSSEEINGVTFHIPNGYNLSDVDTGKGFGNGKAIMKWYSNEDGEELFISVTDNKGPSPITDDDLLDYLYEQRAYPTSKNMKGHAGYEATMNGIKTFSYLDQDKFIVVWADDESLINGVLP